MWYAPAVLQWGKSRHIGALSASSEWTGPCDESRSRSVEAVVVPIAVESAGETSDATWLFEDMGRRQKTDGQG